MLIPRWMTLGTKWATNAIIHSLIFTDFIALLFQCSKSEIEYTVDPLFAQIQIKSHIFE